MVSGLAGVVHGVTLETGEPEPIQKHEEDETMDAPAPAGSGDASAPVGSAVGSEVGALPGEGRDNFQHQERRPPPQHHGGRWRR